MVKSAYIHIPFCRQKCRYCSFVSYTNPDFISQYLSALENEIKHFYKNENLNTVYLGGGTPSILETKQIAKILSLLNFSSSSEITMELNPENLNKKYFEEIKNSGINRLSFGCQSFDSKILKNIGRKHTPSDVEFALKTAQDTGFENISLDFIYGLPEQSLKKFTDDLVRAKNLNIQHISLYGLKIDEGCYFYDNPPNNIADEDLQAKMYLSAIEIFSDFEHYEISNFAKQNFYSRHNLNYWDNENYYGFGAAAHGYVGDIRYSNKTDLKEYINNPIEKDFEHIITKQEKLEEEIFLGFRKMSGINTGKINKKFNIDFEKNYSEILTKYLKSGHLKKTDYGYKLTNEGILVSNIILSEFIN